MGAILGSFHPLMGAILGSFHPLMGAILGSVGSLRTDAVSGIELVEDVDGVVHAASGDVRMQYQVDRLHLHAQPKRGQRRRRRHRHGEVGLPLLLWRVSLAAHDRTQQCVKMGVRRAHVRIEHACEHGLGARHVGRALRHLEQREVGVGVRRVAFSEEGLVLQGRQAHGRRHVEIDIEPLQLLAPLARQPAQRRRPRRAHRNEGVVRRQGGHHHTLAHLAQQSLSVLQLVRLRARHHHRGVGDGVGHEADLAAQRVVRVPRLVRPLRLQQPADDRRMQRDVLDHAGPPQLAKHFVHNVGDGSGAGAAVGAEQRGVQRCRRGHARPFHQRDHSLHPFDVARTRARVGERCVARRIGHDAVHVAHVLKGGMGERDVTLCAKAPDPVRVALRVGTVLAAHRKESVRIDCLDDSTPLVNFLRLRRHRRERADERVVQLIQVPQLPLRQLDGSLVGRRERHCDLPKCSMHGRSAGKRLHSACLLVLRKFERLWPRLLARNDHTRQAAMRSAQA